MLHGGDPQQRTPLSNSPENCDYVAGRSALLFENNTGFRKKMSVADPRAQYFAFVRHWVAGVIQSKAPDVFRKLPSSFCVGAPL